MLEYYKVIDTKLLLFSCYYMNTEIKNEDSTSYRGE